VGGESLSARAGAQGRLPMLPGRDDLGRAWRPAPGPAASGAPPGAAAA